MKYVKFKVLAFRPHQFWAICLPPVHFNFPEWFKTQVAGFSREEWL